METRALLAFLISVAILFGYQVLFSPPRPDGPRAVDGGSPPTDATRPPALPSGEVAATPPETLPTRADEETLTVETDLYRVVFTSTGGRLKHFELKQHRSTTDPTSPPLDMVVSDSVLPMGLYWVDPAGRIQSDAAVVYEMRAQSPTISSGGSGSVRMTGRTSEGAFVSKALTLHGDSTILDLDARIDNPAPMAVGVSWARSIPSETGRRFSGIEGPAAYIDATLRSSPIKSLTQPLIVQGTTDWGGYADHYFLTAYFPEQPRPLRFVAAATTSVGESILWDDTAGGAVAYHLFVGPKNIKLLKSLDHNLAEAIDLGRFAFIARPLLELMLVLQRATGNYGWSIVLLTIGIRVIFYPVNKRQLQAMKAMQRVQPELKRIQEKYKDDRERLNKEMIEVYRRHKVNPLSGCLPMLVQLPVFLGLYNALMQSVELRHAPFIGWIQDLSQPDRLGSWPIPFVHPPGIPVLTLLMGASMVLQQRTTPSTADPVQQRMMMFLPVVFTVMFINFPSGLVLYWLSNNVLSIAQQQLMARAKA